MASFTFNIAKGRIVEFFLSANGGQIVLLEQAEADGVLKDYDTLAAILAAPGNVELAHASYARKTGVGGTVVFDDVLDEMIVNIQPQIWPALQGNPVVKALVCFDWRGEVIPLSGHDVAYTPDGCNARINFP